MVTKINSEKTGITKARFRKEASKWYPLESKILYVKGKPVLKYSGKTKRISKIINVP